ncbi:hypothetical protein SAMN06269185_0309 [Natronoarchaeum philippinense]|uniref:DUF8115 domain-containing protein n=2 Tax=Halobacteriales TaxID=2235 RepID=A0A285N288_NATPI|nr:MULTISPECIES: hypothetical protein [Halobacteria]QSW98181.1 hypothetical protein J0X25_12270 [Haloterrigena alkaliphila]SNZ03562.1 hypothetical protein SAMN06269185_0309 [Natronoarchaeum philippinense]
MDDEIEELKQQTSQGDRLDEVSAEQKRNDLKTAILEELEKIDEGDQQKVVSVWDGPMAALVRALENHPEHLDDVGHRLQDELDVDQEDVDRSEVIRLALRLGLGTAAPEAMKATREAVSDKATKNL